MNVERRTAIIDKRADAILFRLSAFVMMVVMMVFMLMLVLMFMFMLMLMVMLVFMFMVLVIVVMMMLFCLNLIQRTLYLANPCRRRCHTFEMKHPCVDYLVKVDLRIVAFYYLGLRLNCLDDGLDALQLVWADHRCLVEQNDVAEFNLLDYQILNIFLADILARKIVAAAKLVLQSQRVDDRHNAVKTGDAILAVCLAETRD